MELLRNTTENRRHHSDATGLPGCCPLRHDLKIRGALPRRRAKFVTVGRRNDATASCMARLAPHARGPGNQRWPSRAPARREGFRGATARRVRHADGPAGGKAWARCHGRTDDPVSGMIPPTRPTNLCFDNCVRYKSPLRIGPGTALRHDGPDRTAGTPIAWGRDASAWKGADGACG